MKYVLRRSSRQRAEVPEVLARAIGRSTGGMTLTLQARAILEPKVPWGVRMDGRSAESMVQDGVTA